MPVDTRDKRFSMMNVANPWKFSMPNPDGSLANQADRQHTAYFYRGIAANPPGGTVLAVLERSLFRFQHAGIWRRVN